MSVLLIFDEEVIAVGANGAHTEHDHDVYGKNFIDDVINMRLFETITALVEDQFSVLARV